MDRLFAFVFASPVASFTQAGSVMCAAPVRVNHPSGWTPVSVFPRVGAAFFVCGQVPVL
jgi:hypothetical protein